MHGASAVTAAMAGRFAARWDCSIYNTSSRSLTRRSTGYHWRRVVSHLRAYWALCVAPPRVLYVTGAGGLGLAYSFIAVVLARLRGAAVYFHHHSYAYLSSSNSFVPRLIMRGICRLQPAHIVLDDEMARRLMSAFKQEYVHVLTNAVLVSGSSKRPPIVTSGVLRVGHYGNLMAEKGLLEVLADHADGNYHLSLAGPITNPIDAAAVAEHLSKHSQRCEYLGRLVSSDQRETFLDSVDMLVFPSRYRNEAQPLVILEALGRATPVLARDHGGIRYMLPADWLLDDCESISNGIRRMLERADASERAALQFEGLRNSGEQQMAVLLDQMEAGRWQPH